MPGDQYQTPVRSGQTFEESSADGTTPRPHWQHLTDSLQDLGPEELDRRWALAERRIRENGITYNIYGDPLGANRPWQIDLVPLLIPADEWRSIEAGVIQRAHLLSLLLQDLYGPQTLLNDGHFPAPLLYANPAFLRPLVGIAVPPHSYLHMLAIDLARSPRRPLVGPRRPHPGPLRQRLRPGKPPHRLRSPPRALPQLGRPPPRPLLSRPAPGPRQPFPQTRPTRRPPHPPAPTTRPTSSTPTSPSTSTSPSSKAPTSPSATAAST